MPNARSRPKVASLTVRRGGSGFGWFAGRDGWASHANFSHNRGTSVSACFSIAAAASSEVLAIASCNQLHTDRLALMQRDRHDRARQTEHIDRGNETQIVPEQFTRALRADGILARARRRLHRRRRKYDREIPRNSCQARYGCFAPPWRASSPAGRACLPSLDAAPGGMEIGRSHFQHRGFLQHRGFVGDDVAPGLPDTVDVGNVDFADAVA